MVLETDWDMRENCDEKRGIDCDEKESIDWKGSFIIICEYEVKLMMRINKCEWLS